mmetsp:Transcript_144540/g.255364  ORF Transcript_144540/g.255364 Transcript_144540/m.255364 type:complete len:409 (-) Transcript_144540:34-1260(-)
MALPELSARLQLSGICALASEDDTQSASTTDGWLETLQLRESYSQLQERYVMMETAARAEISELRLRLQEAHQRLAEMHAEQTVSGLEVQVSARRNMEAGMKQAEQTAFLARSEVRQKLEVKLQSTGVYRLVRHRGDCLQLRCLAAWRTLAVLESRQRLEQIEQPSTIIRLHRALLCAYNCWRAWFEFVYCVPERYKPQDDLQDSVLLQEQVRRQRCFHGDQRILRHQVCEVFGATVEHFSRRSAGARHVFIAWQLVAGRQDRARLRRLVDLAHDSWHLCVTSLHRVVNKHSCLLTVRTASQCFWEWSARYRRHRQLARLWRWLGKERKLMHRCFTAFLQALAIGQRNRIKVLETLQFKANSKAGSFGDLSGRRLAPENGQTPRRTHEAAASELEFVRSYSPPASLNL